jgi:hypothetical protein
VCKLVQVRHRKPRFLCRKIGLCERKSHGKHSTEISPGHPQKVANRTGWLSEIEEPIWALNALVIAESTNDWIPFGGKLPRHCGVADSSAADPKAVGHPLSSDSVTDFRGGFHDTANNPFYLDCPHPLQQMFIFFGYRLKQQHGY